MIGVQRRADIPQGKHTARTRVTAVDHDRSEVFGCDTVKRREARPPSPWPWVGASIAILGALGVARWWMEHPAPQAHTPAVTLDEGAWATVIRPSLAARCGRCHGDEGRPLRLRPSPSAAEVIEELAGARAFISLGDPDASALRLRPLGARHPSVLSPGCCLDLALARWIRGGAPPRCDGTLPRGLTPLGRTRAPSALDLSTPERALGTQVELLRRADYDGLRETFVPELTLQLTDRALDACRLAVISTGVRLAPRWVDAGATREVRVMGEGGAPTRFVSREGRWLADRLWCVD